MNMRPSRPCHQAVALIFIFLAAVTCAGGQIKVDEKRGGIKYRVGDRWRADGQTPGLALQVAVKSKNFNRKDMLALAGQLKKDFSGEPKVSVFIFDSFASAQTFSIIPHSPTYTRDFKAYRGFYHLDRAAGKEYIEFSAARGKPREVINLAVGQ